MAKTRNILYVLLAGFALAITLLSFAMVKFDVKVPEWTGIGAVNSKIEGREYILWDDVKKATYNDGLFQASFEDYVSDHVPMRDNVLLLDAALQRNLIELAIVPFGFDTYPPYYGSNFAIARGCNLIVEQSLAVPGPTLEQQQWIDALNKIAMDHHDVRFAVDLVLQARQDDDNPTYELLGGDNLVNEQWAQTELADKLDPALNAFVDGIGGKDELLTMWNKSDTHWNLERALQSYNKIAAILDLAPATWDEGKAVTIKQEWFGLPARHARYFGIPTDLVDMSDDFSMLDLYKFGKVKSGKKTSSGKREKYYAGDKPNEADIPSINTYKWFYGGKNLEAINRGENNGKTCLIIGDSCCWNVWRYIARNYAHTVLVMPGNAKVNMTIGELFDKYDFDDAIVLMQCQKYSQFPDYSPTFMNV